MSGSRGGVMKTITTMLMTKRAAVWGATVTVLALSWAPSVRAAEGPFASLRGCATVPDRVLAHMRGRYVGFGEVQYFGVRMETQWTTANGTVMSSAVNLGIHAGPGNGPTIGYQVHTSVTPGTGTGNEGGQGTNVGTNIGGQGVTQVIQLASDGNAANNSVAIDVTDASHVSGEPSGVSDGTGSAGGGGILVTAGVNGNGVGTSIVVPGQGRVTQQLAAGSGGLMQNVMLTSAMNQVQNNLTLTLGLAPGASLGDHGIPNEVLHTTLGLPGAGL